MSRYKKSVQTGWGIPYHVCTPYPFNRERLDSIELYPFRKAIEAGVGGIMVGHLNIPAFDTKAASVSYNIVTELLKNELGFRGMIFTDALEMKGISNTPYVSAQALEAGNDMVLAPRNLKRGLYAPIPIIQ